MGVARVIKYLLGIFNILVILLALVIIYFGAYSFHRPDYAVDVIEAPEKTAIALIVVGLLLFLLAFFGCAGSFFESKCMLTTFSLLLTCGILVELAAGVFLLSYKTQLEPEATKIFKKFIEEHNKEDKATVVDDIQKNLKCCGASNKTDWEPKPSPSSCFDPKTSEEYEEPCIPKLKRLMIEYYGILGTFAIAFGVLQTFGCILALHVAQTVEKRYDTV